MIKLLPVFIAMLSSSILSACVTQHYENDNTTPVIENDSSKNDIAMTRISLGLGYLKMGNTQQAKLNLEKAKRFSPNLVQVYTAFAHFYDTVGEPEQAIASYEYALSLNDKDADTLNNYGVFLCRHEKYDAAEVQILRAIAIPSYILVAQSYENLALCQLKAKRYDSAELYLEKAILHSPNRASSLLQMIRLMYAKADYKMAQSYLRRYEKSTRQFTPQALALAYKVFAKQNNQSGAINYANMLIKMFPNSFEAKQFILNELAHISADTLAEEYQTSIHGPKVQAVKKRVVMLSPNKAPAVLGNVDSSASLGNHGLKPIMANSVMPNKDQQLEQAKADAIEKTPTDLLVETPSQTTVVSKDSVAVNNELNAANITDKVNSKASEPAPAKVASTTLAKKTPAATSDDNKNSNENLVSLPVHTVKKGDSLFSISRQYNIVMKSLERWNRLRRPYLLRIGDVIYLADPRAALVKSTQK